MIRLSAATRMARALIADAGRFGVRVTIADIAERRWCSATFAGWRMEIAVTISGGDPAGWLAALPEAELTLPDLLVADVAIVAADDAMARLEALLIDDAENSF